MQQKKERIIWDKQHEELMYHRWVHINKRGYPVAFGSYEEFLRWCKRTYEIGCRLERIDDKKPYSKANCKWVPIGSEMYIKQLAKRWDEIMTPIRERYEEQLQEARVRKKEYFRYEHPDLVREGIAWAEN